MSSKTARWILLGIGIFIILVLSLGYFLQTIESDNRYRNTVLICSTEYEEVKALDANNDNITVFFDDYSSNYVTYTAHVPKNIEFPYGKQLHMAYWEYCGMSAVIILFGSLALIIICVIIGLPLYGIGYLIYKAIKGDK